MVKLELPERVEMILQRLHSNGFQAYVVGGCVRDSIMGITPHDWDICTSALPDQVIKLFEDQKVIPTGLQHGTVTVIIGDTEYEITTYRTDGEYKDCRHPSRVEFVQDIKSDLMRRDFTINALTYNHDSGIVDHFNGEDDIWDGIIRCVGDPNERFNEDALRIMRAIRFAIRYSFSIENNTKEVMLNKKANLFNISEERIRSEIEKILDCDLRDKSDLLSILISLLEPVVPEYTKDVEEICKRLSNSPLNYELRLALLFDFENDSLDAVLKRLRFSNETIKKVEAINKYGKIIRDENEWRDVLYITLPSDVYNKTDYFERRLLHDISYDLSLSAIDYANTYASSKEDCEMLDILRSRVKHAFYNHEPCKISDLAIDGNDLINVGFIGKQIGIVLNVLLDMVMRGVLTNNHSTLMNAANSLKGLFV